MVILQKAAPHPHTNSFQSISLAQVGMAMFDRYLATISFIMGAQTELHEDSLLSVGIHDPMI